MGSGITSGECQAHDAVNISEEEVSQWLYTSVDTVIITIIMPIILCFGVITNFTFLFVSFRIPKIRSDTNVYLMHLALADLLYLSLATLFYTWSYTASEVVLHMPFENSAECIIFFTVVNTGYFASIALVTMVSFERYLALCHPMKHLRVRGRRRTYRLVVICWLVGLAFSGLTAPSNAILIAQCLQWPDSDKYQGFPSTKAFCSRLQPWVRHYVNPLVNIPWVTAMTANIYMYVRIVHMLNKRRDFGGTTENSHQALHIRNQVAKMLIGNGIVFFICQMPYRVVNLSDWFSFLAQTPDPISNALGNIGFWVSFLPQFVNVVVNPLIYGAMNSLYRVAFIQAIQCKGHSRQGNSAKSSPIATHAAAKRTFTSKTLPRDKNNETQL